MKDIRVERTAPLPQARVYLHLCDRSTLSTDKIRKFKAECGTTLEARIKTNGVVRSIKPLDTCQPDCVACTSRIEKIRQLVAQGK